MKKIIKTAKAPLPIGPYNQAILSNDTLYISEQVPIDPATGVLVKDSIEAEARQVMQNIKNILEEAGLSFSDIVKTQIFITDIKNFVIVNKVYAEYFTSNFPARDTIQVCNLPLGANVGISAIAVA